MMIMQIIKAACICLTLNPVLHIICIPINEIKSNRVCGRFRIVFSNTEDFGHVICLCFKLPI